MSEITKAMNDTQQVVLSSVIDMLDHPTSTKASIRKALMEVYEDTEKEM